MRTDLSFGGTHDAMPVLGGISVVERDKRIRRMVDNFWLCTNRSPDFYCY